MKFDVTIFPEDLNEDVETAKRAEAAGFDAFWTAEVAHNPFFPLLVAGLQTRRIQLGTQIAVAFPRSPMITAYTAWDLAAQTGGRFILGLGSQVKAHITKRYSSEWSAPAPRMREYVESLHAIWDCWQHGKPLNYRGESYKFTLMTPFFTPKPIAHASIPVYIAGVNEYMCRVAGEVCGGIHLHGFHTVHYLQQVVIPALNQGLQKAGRPRSAVELVCPVFVVTGRTAEEKQAAMQDCKTRIAFYASTPSYEAVMTLHGWSDIANRLSWMAREGRWNEMADQISDDMLTEFAIVAEPDEVFAALRERYTGIVDRVCVGYDRKLSFTEVFFEHAAQMHQ